MIDPQTEELLQGIVRRESRSLLAYIGEAFPWTTVAGAPGLATLKGAVKDECSAVEALGKFLVRQRSTPPALGSYPASFTSFNFVALSYLLPRLIAEEQQSIAAHEAELPAVNDRRAKELVETLLRVKKRNLATLQSLASPKPVPA